MTSDFPKLILASQSSARKRLLTKLLCVHFPKAKFETRPAHLDERALLGKISSKARIDLQTARRVAKILAIEKARAIFDDYRNEDVLVLGSDQLLLMDGKVLGKPGTRAKAIGMLKSCAGKTGYLVTSVAILQNSSRLLKRTRPAVRSATQVTTLQFAKLSTATVSRIVDLDQPLECAGSFKFEEHGASLFSSVKTDDPTGIEGLPSMRVIELLKKAIDGF